MEHEINTWNVEFYKLDEYGNAIRNKDGSIKLFTLRDSCDCSWISDCVDDDCIEPVDCIVLPKSKGYTMGETMEFVRDHFLQWELIGHHTDHDAYLEFHNYRTSTHFCKYPYADEGSLIEGIHFIMDMHYRKEAEDKAHANVR